MPKQKFNNFDICAEVACLRKRVVGMWLTNVYDLDAKRSFLFKFNRGGCATASGEAEKITVLMESGARFHTTSFTRERKGDAQPSKFNMKLRMHLRSKRLNDIAQYGSDRAVDFTFGAGESEHHLILELYAQVRDEGGASRWTRRLFASIHLYNRVTLARHPSHPRPICRFTSMPASLSLSLFLERIFIFSHVAVHPSLFSHPDRKNQKKKK